MELLRLTSRIRPGRLVFDLDPAPVTDDSIEGRKFFFIYRIAFSNIASITPHKKDRKWSHGRVFLVTDTEGRRYTFQPKRPDEFLQSLQRRIGVLFPQLEPMLHNLQ